jgi:hypothetical protein
MTFRHLVIVLPGITGSVLEQHGREAWSFSVGAGWQALRTRGESINALALDGDDPDVDDLGDGVRAVRIVHRAHSLPGLHKNLGYGPLLSALRERLGAEVIEFPYDWRRDNRASARALRRVVHERLPLWREASGAADAKVVLVAHSMGGLVSRYYLECLDGWEECRALVTFGTPYRGAPSALDYLANGYKKLFLDVSEAMRSFTSVYQLLPRYPMVELGHGQVARVSEAVGIPHVDANRARDALAFHAAIDTAVEQHQGAAKYSLIPIVGMRQPTLQSAQLVDGRCVMSRNLPVGWPAELADGDGTVPRASATPIELSTEVRDTFLSERHAALQVNAELLEQICMKLEQLHVAEFLSHVRGAPPSPRRERAPAVAIELDDAYAAGESVVIRATTINYVEPITNLQASVVPIEPGGTPRSLAMRWTGEAYEVAFEGLSPGPYVATVTPGPAFPVPAPPVRDLFEVVG